jgi:hypothetical protein
VPKKRPHFQVPWCKPVSYEGTNMERSGSIVHHRKDQCRGGHCPFHNPSDHIMVDWDMFLRETGLIERICPHGVGHPDPDSAAFLNANGGGGYGVHGCDGCCVDPLAMLRTRLERLLEVSEQ